MNTQTQQKVNKNVQYLTNRVTMSDTQNILLFCGTLCKKYHKNYFYAKLIEG